MKAEHEAINSAIFPASGWPAARDRGQGRGLQGSDQPEFKTYMNRS